jgi:hypothetical protein
MLDFIKVHLELVHLADLEVDLVDRLLQGVHVTQQQIGQPLDIHYLDIPFFGFEIFVSFWSERITFTN